MRFMRLYYGISIVVCLFAEVANASPYEINYDNVDTAGWNCFLCEFDKQEERTTRLVSQLYRTSEGIARFGRETGFDDKGSKQSLDIDYRSTGAGRWSQQVELQHFGLDRASLRASISRPGKMGLTLSQRKHPDNIDNHARSPFQTRGNRLWLAESWVSGYSPEEFSNLEDLNRPVYLRSERQTTDLTGWVNLSSALTLRVSAFRNAKKGVEQTYRDNFYLSTALPKPIEWSVEGISTALTLDQERVVGQVSYQEYDFRSEYQSFHWQSPYVDEGFIKESSFEPSYRRQALEIAGSLTFTEATQMKVSAKNTRTKQHSAPMLPYTTNPVLETEFTGREVAGIGLDNTHLAVRLLHDFSERLSGSVLYEINERIDLRGENLYRPVLGDWIVEEPRPSRAYDTFGSKKAAGIRYRITDNLNLDSGYQVEKLTRSLQEINTNQTQTIWVEAFTQLGDSWHVSSRYSSLRRDAGAFQQVSFNHPGTRRFHQAERDSRVWRGEFTFARQDWPWSSSVLFDHADHDYPTSPLGLQSVNGGSLFWSFTFGGSAHRTFNIAYGVQESEAVTQGNDWSESGDWTYKSDDKVSTLTSRYSELGFLHAKVDLKMDLSVSEASGNNRTETRLIVGQFPTLISDSYRFQLQLSTDILERTPISLTYVWEKYRSSDWALDGAGQTRLWNVLSLDRSPPNYVNQMVVIGLSREF